MPYDAANFWDPEDAGYVVNEVSDVLRQARRSPTVWIMMDLGISGYNKLRVMTGPSDN